MPDGTPQVTPVWFDYTGGVIRVNSAKGRTKTRNMKEGAPVALSIMDPDNPYRYLQVRGKVTRVTEEGAGAHINSLAKKYLGQDKYPWSRPGEVRVTFEISAECGAGDGVTTRGGTSCSKHSNSPARSAAASRYCAIVPASRTSMPPSTPDLYFGLGVAMAQDRLWQMDRLRRRALGRQAEILGPAYVASDIAHLTVGIDRIAEREADALDEATHRMVAALVAGINRQIELMGRDLPPEFRKLEYMPEPFTVRDVVAIARGIWWSLNGRIDRIVAAEAARLLPEKVPPAVSDTGSLGEPRAAARRRHRRCDRQQQLGGAWQPNGGRQAGAVRRSASAVLGAVALVRIRTARTGGRCRRRRASGLSRHVVGQQRQHRLGDHQQHGLDARSVCRAGRSGRSAALSRRRRVARIRRTPGRASRCVARRRTNSTIRSTVRGPVVNALVPSLDAAGDPPLSLRWIGMEHMDDIRASIAISRARDWAGFRAALRDWSVAIFNFVYADASGHIGYQMAGRIPIRGRVVPGFRDANAAADQWQGTIPFDDLPHMYDPPSGYVASANQRIVPDDWKQPIYGAYSQGHRGVRLDAGAGRRQARWTARQTSVCRTT